MSAHEMLASDSAVQLKVLINKNEERVVFAEASGDFVDILFSFLTMPMGTIVRALARHSESSLPMAIGSLSTLHGSLKNLETRYFTTEACKDMLLDTRNSAEAECQQLKINIGDVQPYFICEGLCPYQQDGMFVFFSTSRTKICQQCGKFMNLPMYFSASTNEGFKGIFVNETASFVIHDDLKVIPSTPGVTLEILKSSGITDLGVLEETTLQLGSIQILDLLEKALFSKTCLTDMVFGKKCIISPVPSAQHRSSTYSVDSFKKMTVNVMVQKSKNTILLAHASEEFVEFLFNFLTIPLGRAISVLSKNDIPAACVENLHLSVSELSVGEYLISQQMKDLLLDPHIATIYQGSSQLFPPKEERKLCLNLRILSPGHQTFDNFSPSTVHSVGGPELRFASPKGEGGLLKESTKFMVTDDLVVTPLSSMSYIKYLQTCNVPLSDIEEQVIDIGMEEALSLLRESLISNSVLTNGLKHLIRNKPNAETLLKRPKVE